MLHLVDEGGGPLLRGNETGTNLVLVHGRVADELLLLILLRLIETSDRNIVELSKFLLNKIHDVSVYLVLQTAGRLQSIRRRLDIIVNERVDSIAALLDVLKLAAIDTDFLAQTRLIAYEKLRTLVESFYVKHEIFSNVENVLEFV